jgi:tRNA threonylcarbamoyladenosine biosynthesis protein TsaE
MRSTDMSIFAELRAGVVTSSAEETRALARRFAAALGDDSTVALHGDLGVGKTTFVQGLAEGMGVVEHVTSPTFAIYSVHRGAGRTLVHLDAYRIERPEQVEDLLLDEFLRSPWVLAVEWPEKVGSWLPANAMHLELSIVAGDRHRLRLR